MLDKTTVAALYYVLPRWGSTRYGITNAWRGEEVPRGAFPSSLIRQHNGIMSARFCQNGSDRDSSGIRHDTITPANNVYKSLGRQVHVSVHGLSPFSLSRAFGSCDSTGAMHIRIPPTELWLGIPDYLN